MSEPIIKIERDGAVAILRLNRPDQLNALTVEMIAGYVDVLDTVDADNGVRAVVVTVAGRAFCAGADLSGGADTFNRNDEQAHRDRGGILNLRIFEMTKPMIAAINGPAVGLGATQTLPMDIRIASETAKIGFVFARRGIVADGCASWFLPRVVGVSKALEWTMSGRVFGAQEALDAGLVRDVLPPDQVLPKALELAHEIADNTSAVSVALNRQMLWRMLGADHPIAANELESRALNAVGGTPDAHEGVTSFLEKRPAKYPGRVPADLPDFYPWWPDRPYTPLP
ncbi:MAG TPA: crotonase/enoyl-CoA hydratase family protein [Pseudonocardia sp.]|nr:crotonase/enoyl-CoA hydratase family protein [Pseudonocardia sp.]